MRNLIAVLLVFVSPVLAQEFRATLQGTIIDPNNAVVPGAKLTLTNTATAVQRETVSDSEGHYVFQFVTPGTYSLATSASGFKTDTRSGIELSVGQNLRLDVNVVLGETSEKVVVEANAVAVAAESSSLGAVIRREIIDSLPIKGHGSLTMFVLAPGIETVSLGDKFSDDVRPIDQANNQRYSANGSPVGTGDTAVDGVPNMIDVNRGYYINGYVPPVDSVGEFKLQMGTLPAEYGKSSGSIMTVVIKSGTNNLHGTLYENLRNTKMDANLFFNNIAGQKLPTYQVNMFGLSLGGPVYLPRIYNGRNRTFFFVNYEGLRQNQAQSARINVPTPKMRAGDFSEVSAAIYNASPGNYTNQRPNRGLAISETYIFSPRVAADFRAGLARGDNTTTPFSSGFDVSALGFSPAFLNSGLQGQVFPQVGVTDMNGLGNGGFANNPGTSLNTADALTISLGKHLFKAGGEFRLIRGNYFANSAPTGTFSFGPNQTGGPNASTPTGGFGLATLLVGFGSGSSPTGTGVSSQNAYYAL
ncbi:MAG: carboxypeptidase-like regulatory domain-containing protein, partial [Acidobacteria bacterium]|nr:carboxypeptidase-like regulatory domain-containing protein [Acidobacteriota bacterium]